MNIALSAVVIFILLLPPIAFYLSFSFVRFPRAAPKLGLLEGLMLSAIFAAIFHSLALLVVHKEIRFDIIALILGGDLKTFGTLTSNESFKQMLTGFVLYNSILVAIAVIVGAIFRMFINRYGWHTRMEVFRLYNHWWYLFQGYKIDSSINQQLPPAFDIVFVDALVNTNAGTMIYSGYLIDFVCHGETLDRIYLAETSKREFKSNAMNEKGNYLVNQPGEPKSIDGDTVSIAYSTIINLNLRFVKLPDDMESITENSILETGDVKFEIVHSTNGKYHFWLQSANGELVLISDGYSTKREAIQAIETVKQVVQTDDNFMLHDNDPYYTFNLLTNTKTPVAHGEIYLIASARDNAIDLIKRIAPGARVVDTD